MNVQWKHYFEFENDIHQNGNIEEAKNLIPESVKLIDPKIGIEYNTSH